MAKITICDLSPKDDSKSINELTGWELNQVYAGYAGVDSRDTGYSAKPPVDNTQEQKPSAMDQAQASLARWMDSIEFQIRDLRKQIGISA